MCVCRNSWYRRIIYLFFVFFSSFTLSNTYTTDNINKVLLQDKVRKMFDVAYSSSKNLPITLDEANNLKKLNLLRSIAQKSSRAALALGKRNPLTAIGVALGAGVLIDNAIDSTFQQFTSAEKDEKGYFVWVKDPITGVSEKYYLDTPPTQYQPVFVYKKERDVVFYWGNGTNSECDNENVDNVLTCLFDDYISYSYTNSKYKMNGSDLSWKNDDDTERLYNVNYTETLLGGCNSNCSSEHSLTFLLNKTEKEVEVTKKYEAAIPNNQVLVKSLSNNSTLVSGYDNVRTFLDNLIKLNSQEFTQEERQLMDYAFSPLVMPQVIPNMELTKSDLLDFNYTDDMFDDNKNKKTSIETYVGEHNNASSKETNNDYNGSPDYPELNPPTAYQILEPFEQFFPELRNVKINGRDVACPTWSFNALNRTYTIDGHCPILEDNRSVLSTIFILIWSLISVRKLLSA